MLQISLALAVITGLTRTPSLYTYDIKMLPPKKYKMWKSEWSKTGFYIGVNYISDILWFGTHALNIVLAIVVVIG